MPAPYQPPTTELPEATPTARIKNWNGRQLFTAVVSAITVSVLAMVAITFVTQAMRLNWESASLPARLQADYASTARSSWIAATAAIIGMLLNMGGLLLVRKNRLKWPMAFIGVTIAGMIIVAMLFKPS